MLCNLRPARRSEAACPLREGADTGDLTDKDMTKGQSIRGDEVSSPRCITACLYPAASILIERLEPRQGSHDGDHRHRTQPHGQDVGNDAVQVLGEVAVQEIREGCPDEPS